MDHIAYLDPAWGFLPRILSGQKKIESRWYRGHYAPYGEIGLDEMIYFKETGRPVTARARVSEVVIYDDLKPADVEILIARYGDDLGLTPQQTPAFLEHVRHQRCAILISLSAVESIPPFQIDKRGFGRQAAWLCVPNIAKIARPVG